MKLFFTWCQTCGLFYNHNKHCSKHRPVYRGRRERLKGERR